MLSLSSDIIPITEKNSINSISFPNSFKLKNCSSSLLQIEDRM